MFCPAASSVQKRSNKILQLQVDNFVLKCPVGSSIQWRRACWFLCFEMFEESGVQKNDLLRLHGLTGCRIWHSEVSETLIKIKTLKHTNMNNFYLTSTKHDSVLCNVLADWFLWAISGQAVIEKMKIVSQLIFEHFLSHVLIQNHGICL